MKHALRSYFCLALAVISLGGCGYVKNIGDPKSDRDFYDLRDSKTVEIPLGNATCSKEEAVKKLQGYFSPSLNKKTMVDEALTVRVCSPMGVLDTLTSMDVGEAEALFTFHYTGGYYQEVISRTSAGQGMDRVTYRTNYAGSFDYQKKIPFRQINRIRLIPIVSQTLFVPTISSWSVKLDYVDGQAKNQAPDLQAVSKDDAQAIAEAISVLAR